jgi:phage I-like protein
MERNAKALLAKGQDIQVNYNHLGDSEVAPLEKTVAAGWIQDVQLRDDGLWALMKWTDRARAFIQADELRYLSPEFFTEYTNRDTGKPQGPTLVGAALTNTPFLKELPRVAASDTTQAEPSADTKARRMDKKAICAALGLSEDTADDVVLAKLKELTASEKTLKASEHQAGVKLGELQAEKAKLATEVADLKKNLTEVLAEKNKAETKAFIDSLISTGRLEPALRPGVEELAAKHGLDAIKFMEKAPPNSRVNMNETGVEGDKDAGDANSIACRKFEARRDELRKGGMKFSDATKQATKEMPREADIYFSDAAPPKPEARQ